MHKLKDVSRRKTFYSILKGRTINAKNRMNIETKIIDIEIIKCKKIDIDNGNEETLTSNRWKVKVKFKFLDNQESIQKMFNCTSRFCRNNNARQTVPYRTATILILKKCLRKLYRIPVCVNCNLYIFPLVLETWDKLSLTVGWVFYFPDTMLYTWIMSIRNLLYFNVGVSLMDLDYRQQWAQLLILLIIIIIIINNGNYNSIRVNLFCLQCSSHRRVTRLEHERSRCRWKTRLVVGLDC